MQRRQRGTTATTTSGRRRPLPTSRGGCLDGCLGGFGGFHHRSGIRLGQPAKPRLQRGTIGNIWSQRSQRWSGTRTINGRLWTGPIGLWRRGIRCGWKAERCSGRQNGHAVHGVPSRPNRRHQRGRIRFCRHRRQGFGRSGNHGRILGGLGQCGHPSRSGGGRRHGSHGGSHHRVLD